MIRRVEFGTPAHREVFAEPTPLGLIGVAIGCAALTPIAFGHSLTAGGFRTAAIFCLLFGAGCQLLAGLMSFANHNVYGGTLFTAFTFNWLLNWWALDAVARGFVPDHAVVLATDVAALAIFAVLTYGFGLFSGLLFAFLLDIDLLYACKVVKGFTGTAALELPVALFTVGLGALSLWIAFALLINPAAGRQVFRIAGPVFRATPKPGFDSGPRQAIFAALYAQWRDHGFRPLPLADLEARIGAARAGRPVLPDVEYLAELGALVVTPDPREPGAIAAVRLSAAGIDFHEQVVLKKSQFA